MSFRAFFWFLAAVIALVACAVPTASAAVPAQGRWEATQSGATFVVRQAPNDNVIQVFAPTGCDAYASPATQSPPGELHWHGPTPTPVSNNNQLDADLVYDYANRRWAGTVRWQCTTSGTMNPTSYDTGVINVVLTCVTTCSGNNPPVAVPDRWNIRAGFVADENVLDNDHDPDGDPITARVLKISFASKEWTGMDDDGGFLYTAGPGTTRRLNKTITYVAVDSTGAVSEPVRAVVAIKPLPRAKRSPVRKSASTAPRWIGPGNVGWLCFPGKKSALGTACYYMLSVARTREFNRTKSWGGSSGDAARACLKYGLIPMKNADCAKALVQRGLSQVWDKSVVRNAAKSGDCLLYRVVRKRTLANPRAGDWGKPEYHPLDSLTTPWNGNARLTGYGRWKKGTFGTARWRIPVVCDRNELVYVQLNQPLTLAP